MNGIPDFILYVIIFDVIVGVVILGYVVRRWKGKKTEQPKLSAVIESREGKVFHRCPKCNKLTENPAKEIVYITQPPTEKLLCPYCNTPLVQITTTGQLKIGERAGEEVKPVIRKYDLTVESTKLAEVMKLLTEKGFNPLPIAVENKIHLTFSSDRELKFNKLKESGKILDWKEVS